MRALGSLFALHCRRFRPSPSHLHTGIFYQLRNLKRPPCGLYKVTYSRAFSTQGIPPPPPSGWSRMKLKMQLFLTRKRRKWTRDDIWALFSWLFVGQGLFILVGTTTFASLVLWIANNLQVNDWLARRLARYLAKHTGLDIEFGDPIRPNWRGGRISFRNLTIKSTPSPTPKTIYDLTVDKLEVTLSMQRWLQGKGLVETCNVSGIRGVVDRSSWTLTTLSESKKLPLPSPNRGDFDLVRLSVADLLVKVISPSEDSTTLQPTFRPYDISIFSAELPRFRKHFVLLDIFGAENLVGMLDGSLFSMHIPQITHQGKRVLCEEMRHLKMSSLNVDFFGSSNTAELGNPLEWLTRGSVDVDVFIRLPEDSATLQQRSESFSVNALIQVLKESKLFTSFVKEEDQDMPWNDYLLPDSFGESLDPFWRRIWSRLSQEILNVNEVAVESPEMAAQFFGHTDRSDVAFKIDFQFRNLKAQLPRHTSGIMTAALMRPLVAYINEKRPYIPLSCHFSLPLGRFEGAWSLNDSGIRDAIAEGTMHSFHLLISDRQKKIHRLQRISLWSLYAIFRNIRDSIPLKTLHMNHY